VGEISEGITKERIIEGGDRSIHRPVGTAPIARNFIRGWLCDRRKMVVRSAENGCAIDLFIAISCVAGCAVDE
jgi:hypothetical protein